MQYASKSSEKYLGFRQDEMIAKSFQEFFVQDLQLTMMNSNLSNGLEWQGQTTVKRKTQEPIVASCKAVPVTCDGR